MPRAKAIPPALKKVHAPGNKGVRGGPQPGAGRPPADRSKLKETSRSAALRILGGQAIDLPGKGMVGDPEMPDLPTSATPLDVMVAAMRRAYKLGGPIAAFPYAEKAAPYLHAKISSIELKTPSTPGSSNTQLPGPRFTVNFVRPAVKDDDAEE